MKQLNQMTLTELETLARLGDTAAQNYLTDQAMTAANVQMQVIKGHSLTRSEVLRELGVSRGVR